MEWIHLRTIIVPRKSPAQTIKECENAFDKFSESCVQASEALRAFAAAIEK